MNPVPSKMSPRLVPSTGWMAVSQTGNGPKEYTEGGIYVEPNVDTTCFSIRAINDDGSEDLIHFCDWPELRATIDQFMADRAKEGE